MDRNINDDVDIGYIYIHRDDSEIKLKKERM